MGADGVTGDESQMTAQKVQQICKSTGGYNTMALNEKLYLHFKGWPRIENLDDFTGARVVWLEGNGLRKIEGLQPCSGLRQMYLQQNCFQKIENLEGFDELRTINLSENFIATVENLSHLPRLETLQLNNNNISSFEDIEHIAECKNLRVVELSKNKIEDPRIVDVLECLPELKVLKLDGNPCIRQIKGYRKTLICRLKSLTYLDDRPVFEEERLTAEAWMRGGLEAEKVERQRQRAAKRAQEDRRHKAFVEMIEQAKKERRQQKKKEESRVEETAESTCDEDKSKEVREQQQEHLLNQLEKEMPQPKRMPRREGSRRTKCVIEDVSTNDVKPARTKCVIKEVSASDEAKEQPVWDLPTENVQTDVGSQRRAKTRKDREERLRRAMAAVDSEKSSAPTQQAWTENSQQQDVPAPRFAKLNDAQVEQELTGDAGSWAKASEHVPDTAIVEDDSTAVIDFEELD